MDDMPTSPESAAAPPRPVDPEIEEVFGDGLSTEQRAAPAPDMVSEWRRLGQFLKRPTLAVSVQNGSPFTVLARIYALDVLIMAVLIALAAIAVALGVYIPETELAGIEFTLPIVLLVIIGAPVLEELVFRGWLSGKPGPILALIALAAGAAGFGVAHVANPVLGLALAIIGLLFAGGALLLFRRAEPMGWFASLFPLFFWLTTVAFALVHLANFDAFEDWGSLAILLPLVLPQFILGMFVAYLRVRFGLWAAILLHAAHNATALSIAALAGQLA
jgi:membrane protease YdiL (CAAX protease family)